MSDELRLATERLRRYQVGDNRPYESKFEPHEIDLDKVCRDRHYLADAYLSSHPADSETPIDEEWLRSVGGKDSEWHDDLISFATFSIPSVGMSAGALDFRRRNGEVHFCGVVMNKLPQTRGDLRRLCAALGIELKEKASA